MEWHHLTSWETFKAIPSAAKVVASPPVLRVGDAEGVISVDNAPRG